MTMPNFLIIGAGKSGTTSLYRYLEQHPEIYMSPVKEPRFFALEGEDLNFHGPGDEVLQKSATDIAAYKELFSGVTDEKAVGEASPLYLRSPKAPERIKHYLPNIKLIAILRDPVERAYSSYLHLVRDGYEPLNFEEALRREEDRLREGWAPRWRYKQAGFYYAQLKHYFEWFDRQQIKVLLYEDFKDDPTSTLQSVFRFIGVDDSVALDVSERHNASWMPKSRALNNYVRGGGAVKTVLRPLVPQVVRRSVGRGILNLNRGSGKPQIADGTRRELITLYRDDVLALQGLIDRDLSSWLSER